MAPLLELDSLVVGFPTARGWVEVVRGVDLHVERGECLALVGESGSGKTLIGLSCLALVPPPGRILGGAVRLAGVNLLERSEAELVRIRGRRVGMVFQEPLAAFDPRLSIGAHLDEVLRRFTPLASRARRARALELLALVAISDPTSRLDAYPHQLSGGQRQRAMLAVALAGEPELLVADEPTSALDVTVQAQILDLLERLRGELALSLLLITHNFGVAARLADRVAVASAGHIVEVGSRDQVLLNPQHPASESLMAATPWLGEAR